TAAPISDATLPGLFAAQAAATPDAIAVVCGEAELTYRELADRAERLAAALVDVGVGPERTVGVHLERSIDLVVALVAIERAGGAFVPLEPSWPQRRIEDVLSTSRPTVVLSAGLSVSARSDTSVPTPVLDPENLAYVMYTSGSTGTPKGAMI